VASLVHPRLDLCEAKARFRSRRGSAGSMLSILQVAQDFSNGFGLGDDSRSCSWRNAASAAARFESHDGQIPVSTQDKATASGQMESNRSYTPERNRAAHPLTPNLRGNTNVVGEAGGAGRSVLRKQRDKESPVVERHRRIAVFELLFDAGSAGTWDCSGTSSMRIAGPMTAPFCGSNSLMSRQMAKRR
jgi:hypothetical protein